MERLSTSQVRLDSVAGVGSSTGAKAPSLARFLSQRANQVLGTHQATRAVSVAEQSAATPAGQDCGPVPLQLARQMDQLQRLHSAISIPSSYQGISVVV